MGAEDEVDGAGGDDRTGGTKWYQKLRTEWGESLNSLVEEYIRLYRTNRLLNSWC